MAIKFIYGLVNPSTNNIFYIGQTVNLQSRFYKAIQDSQKLKFPKDQTIQDICKKGLLPQIKVLETLEYNPEDAQSIAYISKRECFWIKQYADLGLDNIEHNTHSNIKSRECLHCHDLFEPKKNKAKFCSPKCRVYHSRELKAKPNEGDMPEKLPAPAPDNPKKEEAPEFANEVEKMIWEQEQLLKKR